jgi:hypothetical protein
MSDILTATDLINLPIATAILIIAYRIAIKVIDAFKTYKDNNMSNLCLEIKEMTKTQMQLIDLITKSLVIAEKNNEKNSESLNQVHFQITSILEKIAVIEERVEQCRINKQ